MSDFPYPVDGDTNVSLPSRKDRIASSCFNFNNAIPNMGGSRGWGGGRGYWDCNPPNEELKPSKIESISDFPPFVVLV